MTKEKLRFGLVGGRLGHSFSPQIHQEIFAALGIDGSYTLLEMPAARLEEEFSLLRSEYGGVNVTIPHKVAVLPLLDEISPEAAAIGAVNTILFTDGRAVGYNTDYFGFGRMLEHNGLSVDGRSACVLGTGGASRAVLQYLRDHGAGKLTVISRSTAEASAEIRERYRVKTYAELSGEGGDLLLNCTPVGMFPAVEESPVSAEVVGRFAAVADLIYNPAETRLLRLARAQHKPAVNGLFMLVAQAVAAEELWLGRSLGMELIARITQKIEKRL